MHMTRKVPAALVAAVALAGAGCESDDAAKKDIKNATEDVRKAGEDAAKDVKDAAGKAGREIEETAKDAARKGEKAAPGDADGDGE
jgi:hypothetical protein